MAAPTRHIQALEYAAKQQPSCVSSALQQCLVCTMTTGRLHPSRADATVGSPDSSHRLFSPALLRAVLAGTQLTTSLRHGCTCPSAGAQESGEEGGQVFAGGVRRRVHRTSRRDDQFLHRGCARLPSPLLLRQWPRWLVWVVLLVCILYVGMCVGPWEEVREAQRSLCLALPRLHLQHGGPWVTRQHVLIYVMMVRDVDTHGGDSIGTKTRCSYFL
jgi:hypothetical protein